MYQTLIDIQTQHQRVFRVLKYNNNTAKRKKSYGKGKNNNNNDDDDIVSILYRIILKKFRQTFSFI